jgi:hypothetical protein
MSGAKLALASFENAGLVRAVGQSIASKGGRIAILYEPNPDAGYVVGVDVGRGWVRAAVANLGTFVYITIGTGVGMGIIINGALYRGHAGRRVRLDSYRSVWMKS